VISFAKASRTAIAIIVLLSVTYFVYEPGLSGPFILDDIPNLSNLANYDALDAGWDRTRLFVFSGDAGPLGRPLSLASFLLDDFAWPAQAYEFKVTNLQIHLLNGLLVFWLAWLLGSNFYRWESSNSRSIVFAFFVAALWLLHPLQGSTVLYVIQRMTQLSTLFMLAGILSYAKWRLSGSANFLGYFYVTLALGFWGMLAVLSKENGALLPFFVLALEYGYIRPLARRPAPNKYLIWASVILFLPAILVIFVILEAGWGGSAGGFHQDGTWIERLLTQSRVVVDYLENFFVPQLQGLGLFHDDYTLSHGLFDPPATFWSAFGLILLIALAAATRTQYPLLFFGVGWFFSGHLMESTVIPLELYFEHRNYLAVAGPILAIVLLSMDRESLLIRRVALAALVGLVTLLAGMSYHNANLWGSPERIANIAAHENPDSVRAQQAAASVFEQQGNIQTARYYREKAFRQNPSHAGLALELLLHDCKYRGQVPLAQIERVRALLRNGFLHISVLDQVETLRVYATNDYCMGLSLDNAIDLTQALLKHPKAGNATFQHAANYHLGLLYAEKRRLNETMEALDRSFEAKPVVDVALQQAIFLSSAGLYKEALNYIELARRTDMQHQHPALRGARQEDIMQLRRHVERKMDSSGGE